MFYRRRYQILCLIVVVLVILSFRGLFKDEYSFRKHISDEEITWPDHHSGQQKSAERSRSGDKYVAIECKINQEVRKNIGLVSSPSNGLEKSVKCIADRNHKEAFVPFSYVKKYFDVSDFH